MFVISTKDYWKASVSEEVKELIAINMGELLGSTWVYAIALNEDELSKKNKFGALKIKSKETSKSKSLQT